MATPQGSHLFMVTPCHRWPEQTAQLDQVVGDPMQAKHGADLFGAAQLELAQSAPLLLLRRRLRLDPAQHLLDATAGVDRLGVALMAGGAAIDGGTTGAIGVLSDVRHQHRCGASPQQSPGCRSSCRHPGFSGGHRRGLPPGIPFTGARCLRPLAIDDQGMAVVHQHMAVAPKGALT